MLEKEIGITPSILDRLIDYDPRVSTEPAGSRLSRLADLKLAVRRDLEWLLNTRSLASQIDEGLEEVRSSMAVYGLPDFTGIAAKDEAEQSRMQAAVEKAIRLFEPRLVDVQVTLDPVTNTDRLLSFRIVANIDIEPVAEPVVFDTILQSGGSGFTVVER